ncbi:MAG TPA: iron-sulfur cluster repair di-iron protein [Vicinamibacterales bacterium]|nr:iron-sulfur cluster repair di-iron protein [Vicinamibacterales bacterium]
MELSSSLAQRTLSDIVNDDLRAASVFERFGLDYCCHGRRTLDEAARDRGLPPDDVVRALEALGAPTVESELPPAWDDLGVLARHIVDQHHRYVKTTIPSVTAMLNKLVTRHGERHPELMQVRLTFLQLAEELLTHLEKEEVLLFPYVTELADAKRTGGPLPPGPFTTALHPIRVMEADHTLAGELAEQLRRLTNGFVPPADGCTTYRACYAELARFEADLHRHIHLENNVLFPRTLELERTII